MVALVFADSDHKPWRTKLHHSQQSAATLLTLLLSYQATLLAQLWTGSVSMLGWALTAFSDSDKVGMAVTLLLVFPGVAWVWTVPASVAIPARWSSSICVKSAS